MKQAYKFIAGNSRVTPFGIALAIAFALIFRHSLGWPANAIFLAILLATLAASTFEPVQ